MKLKVVGNQPLYFFPVDQSHTYNCTRKESAPGNGGSGGSPRGKTKTAVHNI